MAFSDTGDGGASEAPLPSETILLVEDEPAVRALFAVALRQAGYQVLEARNGTEALAVFAEAREEIKLLLTDIRMPYLGGTELAAKLLKEKPELRLLYISGYPTRLQLGPNSALLQKPFVRADLLRAVRDMLDRPIVSA